jgi:inosose dehydratase
MTQIRLAGGPVSWGVDFADTPENPAADVVVRGITAAALEWMELGPVGYLPPGDHGLGVVGTFVFDDLHRPAARAAVLDAVDAAVAAIVAAQGSLLVLIDRPSAARAGTAGRASAAPRLDGRAWAGLVDVVRRAAARAAASGVRAVVHPHAGGYVEFEDEIERLLDAVPADEAGLCLDTGHALYAGSDPADLLSRYGARVEHLHLKDVVGAVRDRGLGFWDAIAAGVFCPVGDGLLDLKRVREALVGYTGFATIEQDRVPGSAGDPGADLRRSVERLRAAGIG